MIRHVPYDGESLLDDYWPVVCDQVAELGAELVLVRASKRARALSRYTRSGSARWWPAKRAAWQSRRTASAIR